MFVWLRAPEYDPTTQLLCAGADPQHLTEALQHVSLDDKSTPQFFHQRRKKQTNNQLLLILNISQLERFDPTI